jgi:hypothetical protein
MRKMSARERCKGEREGHNDEPSEVVPCRCVVRDERDLRFGVAITVKARGNRVSKLDRQGETR